MKTQDTSKLNVPIICQLTNEDGSAHYGDFENIEVNATEDGVFIEMNGEGENFVGIELNSDTAKQLIRMLVRGVERHEELKRK